tara:strand:+ start:603 stop:1751 length:1149 start_codon:yes stop_codon:yes gene_type:complete
MIRSSDSALNQPELNFRTKFFGINWAFVFIVCAIASIGFALLFSASNGNLEPWARPQMVRFSVGLVGMLTIAMIDIRLWLRNAYLIYFITLVLLLAVEFAGFVGMGAQRWIDLGYISFQPSEIMKIALVIALARYFHSTSIDDLGKLHLTFVPLLIIAIPSILILRQPDLGTTLMIGVAGILILFLAGVRMWIFNLIGVCVLLAAPVAWQFLHEYQKTRILTFLKPETDPLGAGYHIIQSKIALGSGGFSGKGFMQGPQSHLHFLPEMQTDFIFTLLAEEFGFIGGIGLIALYCLLLVIGIIISLRARSQFARLLAGGVTITFFLYVFINIAMVMGLVPVVGVPLPLISYGGTAMMTLLFGFGLLLGVNVHRDVVIPRLGDT